MGYSPWGLKESNMTEHVRTHTHTHTHTRTTRTSKGYHRQQAKKAILL